MSGQYVEVHYSEMHDLLSKEGFFPVLLHDVKEMVYEKSVAEHLVLRVYTSIVNQHSRSAGRDAIRVCLLTQTADGSWKKGIGSSVRVYRLKKWKDNLLKRLSMWKTLLGPKCPLCRRHTIKRDGKYGPFWGCIAYPDCTGSLRS